MHRTEKEWTCNRSHNASAKSSAWLVGIQSYSDSDLTKKQWVWDDNDYINHVYIYIILPCIQSTNSQWSQIWHSTSAKESSSTDPCDLCIPFHTHLVNGGWLEAREDMSERKGVAGRRAWTTLQRKLQPTSTFHQANSIWGKPCPTLSSVQARLSNVAFVVFQAAPCLETKFEENSPKTPQNYKFWIGIILTFFNPVFGSTSNITC